MHTGALWVFCVFLVTGSQERIPYGTQAGTIRTRADTVRVRDDAVRGLGTTVSKLTVSSRVCPSGFRMFVLFVYRSHVVRDGR